MKVFIISLLEPVVGYLLRVSLKYTVVLDVKLIELSDRILRDLVRVHVDSLEDSDFSLLLDDAFLRFFAASLLVISTEINNYILVLNMKMYLITLGHPIFGNERLHPIELVPLVLVLILLFFELFSVEFHLNILKLSGYHVHGNICQVSLNFCDLILGEPWSTRFIIHLEEFNVFKAIVNLPRH